MLVSLVWLVHNVPSGIGIHWNCIDGSGKHMFRADSVDPRHLVCVKIRPRRHFIGYREKSGQPQLFQQILFKTSYLRIQFFGMRWRFQIRWADNLTNHLLRTLGWQFFWHNYHGHGLTWGRSSPPKRWRGKILAPVAAWTMSNFAIVMMLVVKKVIKLWLSGAVFPESRTWHCHENL